MKPTTNATGLIIPGSPLASLAANSAEVAHAVVDCRLKQGIYAANPSPGNRAAMECASITLTSLVSYYRGR